MHLICQLPLWSSFLFVCSPENIDFCLTFSEYTFSRRCDLVNINYDQNSTTTNVHRNLLLHLFGSGISSVQVKKADLKLFTIEPWPMAHFKVSSQSHRYSKLRCHVTASRQVRQGKKGFHSTHHSNYDGSACDHFCFHARTGYGYGKWPEPQSS